MVWIKKGEAIVKKTRPNITGREVSGGGCVWGVMPLGHLTPHSRTSPTE